jgi:Brp/Blh family beta-carotene 15,15'-monooxygenase
LLILTIGVSHGSLDHVKGKKLFNILNIKKISIFYFSYILIAILVIIIWIIIPFISLIIFLIVASYHFGKEDTQFLINENSYFNQLLFFLKVC